MSSKLPLFEFAYCGNFTTKIVFLSQIAESEDWYYEQENVSEEIRRTSGLWRYIHYIFSKTLQMKKIVYVDQYAIINTGLLSKNGEDIYMLFEKNTIPDPKMAKFILKTFLYQSSREMPLCLHGHLPEPIDFFEDHPELIYFDTRFEIIMNVDHIYDDNFIRLPKQMQEFDRITALTLLEGAKIKAIRRIKRNNRLVVPQEYLGNIQYLMPLEILGEVIPLVLEKNENHYRANTVLTFGMAYSNARLLMKPESSWLERKKKGTS